MKKMRRKNVRGREGGKGRGQGVKKRGKEEQEEKDEEDEKEEQQHKMEKWRNFVFMPTSFSGRSMVKQAS